ncbi:MAG TPA: hypothetical protein VH371_11285 [Candidatus Limnocylindrales bacterium]|jgi:hypothetical protein
MNDDELKSALQRRAAVSLTDDQRNDVLRAARVRALEPRRRMVPRLAGFLVGTAAVLVLVIIALPILLSPPSQSTLPSNGVNAYPNVVVRSEDELVAMANDPGWNGLIVVARATIRQLGGGPACQVDELCIAGIIGASYKTAPVLAGIRDSASGVGELVATPEGNRWITRLAVPYGEDQISVFQIQTSSVDYLGPAKLSAAFDGDAMLVPQVLASDERLPTDNVYIVSGWWWSGFWPSCPVAQEAQQSPPPELDYYCQGSWITANKPNGALTTSIAGALELPSGNYPAWSHQHSPGEPVQGVFAVRSAGCQIVLEPNCPVWRLIDMVDNSPSPTQQSEPTTNPSPTETSQLNTGTEVLSAEALAEKVGNPNWVGRSVLASIEASQIQPIECPQPAATSAACSGAMLFLTSGNGPDSSIPIVFGVRDATSSDGSQLDDGNGYRWVKKLALPTGPGIYAFTVGNTNLDYLGPARRAADGSPQTIAEVVASSNEPADDVYVVQGWLTHTYEAPCPEPPQDQETPRPNIWDYYCGGSWLTPESESSSPAGIMYVDGLHVQRGAYDDFAVDPQPLPPGGEPVGYEPRYGVYLVRNAGCPGLVTGGCPVWRMVGRLDNTQTNLSPSVQPAATEGAFSTANLGDVSFDYPSSWRINPINQNDHYGAILGFVTSEAAIATSSCPANYSETTGGECTHTYSVPDSSMLVRIDRYTLPSHGIETVACDLGAGGSPVEIGGMSGVTIDPFKESDLPAAGHEQAWRVAAPGDSISNYSIYVVDNGYPNDDTIIDRLLSSFRINSPNELPSSIDEFTARNIALSYYFCAHDPAVYGGSSNDPTVQMGTDPTTGRPSWRVSVSDVVTRPDATPFESTLVLYIDAATGAVRVDSKN